MKEGQVRVSLLDKGCLIKKWEQLCPTDPPAVIEAIKVVKQSVNEYLSQLISQGESVCVIDPADDSTEDEEVKSDSISGFIKEVADVNRKQKDGEKRQINYVNQPKKTQKIK